MIFVTVGTQLPFDRMVSVVNEWAGNSATNVFAQIGPSSKQFNNLVCRDFLEPMEFDKYFTDARFVIAHAGMGSILSALSHGSRLIIIPRQASLGEHRNDHQLATAKRFAEHPAVKVAWNEHELLNMLTHLDKLFDNSSSLSISDKAPEKFITKLRDLINN